MEKNELVNFRGLYSFNFKVFAPHIIMITIRDQCEPIFDLKLNVGHLLFPGLVILPLTLKTKSVLYPRATYIYLPKVLVIPRKRWLHPDMTEKLFTGMLSKKETKKTILLDLKIIVGQYDMLFRGPAILTDGKRLFGLSQNIIILDSKYFMP